MAAAEPDRDVMRRTLRSVVEAWDLRQTQFGSSGMTPRWQLEEQGSGFRRMAETYFPSNGGLLLAVGMMAAGWDGEGGGQPGFPTDGTWQVHSEGLSVLP